MELKKFNIDMELNDDIDCILGLVNFRTGPIAHRLRDLGMKIPTKCEREQSHVLFWFLSLYKEHGEKWNEFANDILFEKKEKTASRC